MVIDRGDVRKRIKKPSKPHRAIYGHTPLSADEDIPWSGSQLIIGTGHWGSPQAPPRPLPLSDPVTRVTGSMSPAGVNPKTWP